jgi:hypothetical protein
VKSLRFETPGVMIDRRDCSTAVVVMMFDLYEINVLCYDPNQDEDHQARPDEISLTHGKCRVEKRNAMHGRERSPKPSRRVTHHLGLTQPTRSTSEHGGRRGVRRRSGVLLVS